MTSGLTKSDHIKQFLLYLSFHHSSPSCHIGEKIINVEVVVVVVVVIVVVIIIVVVVVDVDGHIDS
jgi:hypothetical protein